jgi:copper chaperone NosL
MNPVRHTLILATLAATALAACGKSETQTAVVPLEISQGTSCALDGMLLADYPGPKAQIHYAGQAERISVIRWKCSTSTSIPSKSGPCMAFRAGHGRPTGMTSHYRFMQERVYVHAASDTARDRRRSFALENDAVKFAADGGKVYRFADITRDMVVLDGGAIHDSNM